MNFASDLSECQSLAKSKPLIDGNGKNQAAVAGVLTGLAVGLDEDSEGERLENAVAGALVGGALASAGIAFRASCV
jgi:uracil-DNA glycosylase